jgi:membrane carboxypeptidase/penicillin-binding protein
METTVLSGTANSLKELGWTVISAGKTGTTSKGRDAWFVGYTPHYLCGVWVGEDFKETLNLSGAKNAIPIWAKLMIPLHAHLPKTMFPKPQDVVTSKIDPVTGFLARSGCPLTKDEIFIQGSVPTRYCDLHSGGMKGWIQKFFWKIKEKKFENE